MIKNPTGLCLCGYGSKTSLSSETRRGYKRGEPMKYIRQHWKKQVEYQKENRGFSSDCWIWIKHIHQSGHGRGWCVKRRKVIGAHVLFYERYVGEIPIGHEIHHKCSQPSCVNPEHLITVTRKQHMNLEGRLPYGNKLCKIGATQ